LVGGLVTIQGAYLGVTMIIVGVVMGLLAIKLTDISPRLAAFSFTLPVFGAGRREGGGGLGRGFYRDGNALVLGVLSFFLPCGFTQAVQVYALSTGQAGRAALVMGLFALGTTPGLMGIGSLGALVRGAHAQRLFHLLGVAVAAFAVINLVSGVSMIWGGGGGGISLEASRTDNVTEAGGSQLAQISVGGQGYSPQTTVVYAGQPVRVEFIADGFGCASVVNAKGLGHPDRIVVETSASLEFTPDQPGTYGYQCAMGMYRGSIIAISPPAPPDGPDQQKGTE
jgi:sulfite exporter TauE/SafE